MKNRKLPAWANAWVKHKVTGQVEPALYDYELTILYDLEGTHFNSEWFIVSSPTQRNTLIAVIIYLMGFIGLIAIIKN